MKHVLFYSSFLRCTAPLLGRYTVFVDPTLKPFRAAFRAIFVLAGALACAGCTEPLMSDSEERTQYDRYDGIRQQRVPPYVEDEFGRQRPNLTGRLLTKQ